MRGFSGVASGIRSHVQSSKGALKSAAVSAINSKNGASILEHAAKVVPSFSGVDASVLQSTATALLSGDETAQQKLIEQIASSANDIQLK